MTNQHVDKRYDEITSGMPAAQTSLIFRLKLCCSIQNIATATNCNKGSPLGQMIFKQ